MLTSDLDGSVDTGQRLASKVALRTRAATEGELASVGMAIALLLAHLGAGVGVIADLDAPSPDR